MASTPPPQNQVQRAKRRLHEMLHDPENPLSNVFDTVEKKAKIKREYFFVGKYNYSCHYRPWAYVVCVCVGLCVLVLLYLVIGQGTGLLVNLIGFLYPAYKS